VAIAAIKTEGLDDAGLARVRREAQAMGRLGDHPNIAAVFDVTNRPTAFAPAPSTSKVRADLWPP